MKTKILDIRALCHIGIFAAIIAASAQIVIPMPFGVPMTLQTLAIPLAGIVLGAKNGVIATLVYVLLGAVGVPVFAGFAGGIGIVFGRTGGFIISFPFMAFAAGIGAKKGKLWLSAWLMLGASVNYICGMLMFSSVTSNSLAASFSFVVLPFIPTTIIKIAILIAFGKPIKQMLATSGVLHQC